MFNKHIMKACFIHVHFLRMHIFIQIKSAFWKIIYTNNR